MDSIKEIQAELDAVFPGCRIQYVPLWGHWVITDYFAAPDGSPATSVYYPTPWNLFQLEEGEMTNRKIVFVLSHPDTNEPIFTSCENVLNTMYQAYTGGCSAAFNKWLDRMEEGEDAEREHVLKVSRDMDRESASAAWDRHRGKIISTNAGTTNMSHTDRFIGEQLAAQSRFDMMGR